MTDDETKRYPTAMHHELCISGKPGFRMSWILLGVREFLDWKDNGKRVPLTSPFGVRVRDRKRLVRETAVL